MSHGAQGARTARILELLEERYPAVECALHHDNPLQLLVSTILSAQCTDARVNLVTPALFRRFPDAAAFAGATLRQLESAVRTTGFFRSKARNIRECCRAIQEKFGGRVPDRLEDLVTLPGVGRKTANVILNTAFGQSTIAVDTHIFRIANRTGLAPGKTPLAVEKKLLEVVPEKYRYHAHHWLILHGRYTCIARKPRCGRCVIYDLCEYRDKVKP